MKAKNWQKKKKFFFRMLPGIRGALWECCYFYFLGAQSAGRGHTITATADPPHLWSTLRWASRPLGTCDRPEWEVVVLYFWIQIHTNFNFFVHPLLFNSCEILVHPTSCTTVFQKREDVSKHLQSHTDYFNSYFLLTFSFQNFQISA